MTGTAESRWKPGKLPVIRQMSFKVCRQVVPGAMMQKVQLDEKLLPASCPCCKSAGEFTAAHPFDFHLLELARA